MGVDVEVVVSGAEKRYVQDAYRADENRPAVGKRTAVVLCGQKEMAEAVREACGADGIETFLTNF